MNFYIFGAGSLAREVYGWLVSESSAYLKSFKGFVVEDEYFIPNGTIYHFPILKYSELKSTNSSFLLCISDGVARFRVFKLINSFNQTILSYISNNSIISHDVIMGKGVIVNPDSRLSMGVHVADGVILNCGTCLGHDVTVREFTTVLGNVAINGNVKIGGFSVIGSGVVIHPNLIIGSKSIVGMGSVVIRNVEDHITVFGNPAKKIN